MLPGLLYLPYFLDRIEQDTLLTALEGQIWQTSLKRRVQHYGYQYDYKRHRVTADLYLGDLPYWALGLAKRLHNEGIMPAMPDQMIVNEYWPGQGIAPHVDCEPCFGDTIVSISLGSACVMDFISVKDKRKESFWLGRGSLLAITGEARYDWQHGIAPRKTDTWDGQIFKRERRISLTFRTVVLEAIQRKGA